LKSGDSVSSTTPTLGKAGELRKKRPAFARLRVEFRCMQGWDSSDSTITANSGLHGFARMTNDAVFAAIAGLG
jgi:hypothetical protein